MPRTIMTWSGPRVAKLCHLDLNVFEAIECIAAKTDRSGNAVINQLLREALDVEGQKEAGTQATTD